MSSLDTANTSGTHSRNSRRQGEPIYFMKPYISSQEAENIRNYKYNGVDNGLAYIYFFEPLAEFLVSFVPLNIAPNCLTLCGFLCALMPLVILYTFCGCALIGDLPNWYLLIQAIGFFCYRVFDEMDGKQARRTKNGSPFGMIFDHGVDCFAAGLEPLIFARCFQIGDNLLAKIFFISVYQSFYTMTLEHYYLGTLVMPPINGVSDGCLVMTPLMLYSAYYGNNVWATPVYDVKWMGFPGMTDLTIGQCMALFISVSMYFVVVPRSFYKILKSKWNPLPCQNEPVVISKLLKQWSFYWVWVCLWLSFAYMGRDPIRIAEPTPVNNESARHMQDQYDYGQAFHSVHYLLFLFVVVYQSLNVMTKQLCKSKFEPYSNPIKILFAAMGVMMAIGYFRNGDVNFKMSVTMICGVFAVHLGQFIVTVIGELTTILDIEVFTTKQEVEKRRERERLKQQVKQKGVSSIFSANSNSQSEEIQAEQSLAGKLKPKSFKSE